MHYYYLEHGCSLSFAKGYLIPLVLMSQLCSALLGHACKNVLNVSSVQHRYGISNEVFGYNMETISPLLHPPNQTYMREN